jgi:sigma-E factor negative regulatory protein RseC
MNNNIGSGTINHDGIVQKADERSVTVSIISSAACSGCHAEGSCSMSGKEEKIIEVRGKYDVSTGDRVVVLMKQSMGFTALFLGYLLPLLIVIITLIILISVKIPELSAGLSSLAVLIPYYSALWFLRNRINEKFTFTLKA